MKIKRTEKVRSFVNLAMKKKGEERNVKIWEAFMKSGHQEKTKVYSGRVDGGEIADSP